MAARSDIFGIKKIAPLVLMIILLIVVLVREEAKNAKQPQPNTPSTSPANPGEYLFCTWNVENLFDDVDDKRNSIDEPYDNWLARQPNDLNLKLKHLSEALLKMNGGKGPDILCAIEVESKRAAQLLADALNSSLPADAAKYETVVLEEISAGRHIAPAIITRLPLSKNGNPRNFPPHRVLRVTLAAGDADLVVFATHWTSRLSDKEGVKRAKYANLVYGKANEIFHSNPAADILVCGDFNDEPDDPAVSDRLKANGDFAAVRDAKELRFFNLMAGKDPRQYGTIYYKSKPSIYDQICVSPGLLDDRGWSCEINSIQTFTDGLIRPGATRRQPWRFGNERNTMARGYSDHFPVIVKLRVNPPAP